MKKAVKGILLIIILLVAGVIGYESLVYVARTREKAEARATERFLEECKHNHLKPQEFEGPFLIREGDIDGGFVWRNKTTGSQILVSVEYFPIRSESWYLPKEMPK